MKPWPAAIAAAVLLCGVLTSAARAEDAAAHYPNKLVRLIVPFPAGGAVDVVARAMAARLGDMWKQPVIVDNKPGASGAIATAELVRAPKDGYTLMTGVGTNTSILKVLKPQLPFDPIKDLAPVSLIATFPNILVVRPDLPAKDVGELVALAKASPGKYTFGSSGDGSPLHLAGELFKLTTGTDLLHVPFTGSAPATNALLGGHVDMTFDTMPSVWSAVQAGKLRALGTASLRRTPAAPDLPAISETFPGYGVTAWQGVFAPAGTDPAVIAKISVDIRRIVEDPAFARSMLELGAVMVADTPAEFATFVADDYDKWRRVIREAGLKAEE